jgi:hypothetical protein
MSTEAAIRVGLGCLSSLHYVYGGTIHQKRKGDGTVIESVYLALGVSLLSYMSMGEVAGKSGKRRYDHRSQDGPVRLKSSSTPHFSIWGKSPEKAERE